MVKLIALIVKPGALFGNIVALFEITVALFGGVCALLEKVWARCGVFFAQMANSRVRCVNVLACFVVRCAISFVCVALRV